MVKLIKLTLIPAVLMGLLFLAKPAQAQFQTNWLSIGSLHNWYISTGAEREHGLVSRQQYGLRWPAIYLHQDSQAAKGLWIGARNWTDERGEGFPHKVVHVGPRVSGAGSVFPLEMSMVSKYTPPDVLVQGIPSFQLPVDIDAVDPDIPADRMIVNRFNTALGVTVERRIMQFSNEYHDNYHISEYIFTNTGNVNEDANAELPNQVVEDMMVYLQYRYSVNQSTRYTIGNSTGWGINTMVDRRGDGLRPDEPETFRAQFAWHGRLPAFTDYHNLGAPIWTPNTSGGFLSASDTTGRLGAYQFVGNVVLHADTSPSDPTDDPAQPFTMSQLGSDDVLTSGNDPFNQARMQREYDLMKAGRTPRHAYIVEPSGDFANSNADPSLGTSGGWSAANGFGPYTLQPGESVRIVLAEGMSGISREAANYIGDVYKNLEGDNSAIIPFQVAGQQVALTKNEWVMTGRDSLFQTFERAIANFNSGYNIPTPPVPPSVFQVDGGGDGIFLNWDYEPAAEADIQRFEIYRAADRVDSTYKLIHTASPGDRFFQDGDNTPAGGPIRGRDYFYYITAVGQQGQNTGVGLTPVTPLRSSRYYTQTYDPARLQRPAGETMSEIVIAPNPYIATARSGLVFDDRRGIDRIAFFEIPGRARIRIYTELGEHITTIEHANGSGDAFWDLFTQSRQKVVSGVYIAVIENEDPNSPEFGKQVIKKFVIVI
jgi:hypothetical protein